MPKHRRRKNQRNRNNKGNNGNNKQQQQQHQHQQQEQQFGGEKHFGESSQVTTGTNPDIEEIEEVINCERKETITERSQLKIKNNDASDDEDNEDSDADDNRDESKIANDKLSADDNVKKIGTKEINKNFSDFSDICEVTESYVYAYGSSSKTGSKNSREDKAPSEERTEHVQDIPADDQKGHLHESPTSTSLASTSSDSDTIKADELSPDREVDSVVSLDSHDLSDVTKNDKAPLTPVRHPIVHEVITTSYSYRVESPKPIKIKPATRPIKKSRSLDDDDLMIQEISDNSSAGDLTDNQPLVSEAESEGDLDAIEPLEQDDSRILSIQTLPLETTEEEPEKLQELASSTNAGPNSTSSEDFKVRRAKKRAAIETHFMPQFLNPRYLDSIKEENSDISDIERKSGDSLDGLVHQRSSSSITDNDLEDDVFLDNEPITKKANAVFPKINLDFTQRKKRGSNLRSPKADVIREESPCYVVEAKIFEQDSIEESCSTWTMKEAPESGAAEIVFIDSASSSSSDIMDLDETGGDDADVEDFLEDQEVRIETPTINGIIGETRNFSNSPTPTREGHTTESNEDEIINRRPPPVDCESEAIVENSAHDHILEISPIGDGSSVEQSRSKVAEANMENLDKEFDKVLSDNQLIDLVTDLDASSGSESEDSKTRSTTVESSPERIFDSLVKCDSNNLEYSRQDSSGSHGSGQSQSTVYSQCTAINKGSLSGHDLDGFDIPPCISGSSLDQQSTSLETAPKTLKQLCIEELASMPYGREVLEELAVVSESLSYLTKQHQEARKKSDETEDMPYPIPELPRIEDVQLPGSKNNVSEPIQIKLVSTLKSPSPPPIPEPPEEAAWFGVPTEEDPRVLVCLSPAQRNYMKETNTINEKSATSLLDMHNKFVERRGYHELTTEQLNAINREKSQINEKIVSSTKLRNHSRTPPPIPPPPENFNSLTLNENEISRDDNNTSDKNNHRLLAIIRDSTQSTTSPQTSEIISNKTENIEEKSVVNNSRSEQETQTDKPIKATRATTENVKSTEKVSSDKSNQQQQQQPQPTSTEMPQSQFEKDFMEYLEKGNPFKDEFKRSSAHIETTPHFCSQLSQTRPKRYSNIETSTFESKKRIENGNVIYDLSNSDKQKFTDTSDCDNKNVFNIGTTIGAKQKEPFVSDVNIDAHTRLKTDEVTTKTTTEAPKSQKDQFFSQNYKNRKNFDAEKKSSDNFSYNEFRQRAKEAAEKARNEFFARENLLKDFDDISSVLKDDMFTTETSKSNKATTDHFSSSKSFEKNFKEWEEFSSKFDKRTECSKSFNIPVNVEKNVGSNFDGGWKEFGTNTSKKSEYEEQKKEEKREVSSKVYDIPIKIEGKAESAWEELNKKLSTSKKQESNEQTKVRNVPIKILKQEQKSEQIHNEKQKEVIIPIHIEPKQKSFYSNPNTPSPYYENYMVTSPMSSSYQDKQFTEKRLSSQNLDEWMKYAGEFGNSSENIAKPFLKEMEICHGRRGNVRAPRLTASTSNLNTRHNMYDETPRGYDQNKTSSSRRERYQSCHSMIDQTPITQYVTPQTPKRSSLPREIHVKQLDYIKQKEKELHAEFERLENDRRQLIEEMEKMQFTNNLRKDSAQYHSCQLPTLSEEESFRQQMHDEWLSKIAEREERRLHKIIKISKPTAEVGPEVPHQPLRTSSSTQDISDEFLRRVKERRSKLHMPSDSDWESGAESQPTTQEYYQPSNEHQQQHGDKLSDNVDINVKVLEGQKEADLQRLPKHLREFAADFISQIEEEQHEEKSSTIKKSTKIINSSKDGNLESLSPDGESFGQISPSNQSQPKLATILRHKITQSSASGEITTKRTRRTRFVLSPNRKSWSESDLLKEIDNELVLSKGFLFGREPQPVMFAPKFNAKQLGKGAWSPGKTVENTATHTSTAGKQQEQTVTGPATPTPPTPPPLPVWSPQPSPPLGRKEFRPVKFTSPVLPRRYVRQDSAPVAPPWSESGSRTSYQSSSCSNINTIGTEKRVLSSSSTTNIGQRIRDSPFLKGTLATEPERPKPLRKDDSSAFSRSNEAIYSFRNEYLSEPECEIDRPRKMAQIGRQRFEGIGPTTKDGMPIVLRSEVKENDRHQWYQRMYNTLHKAKDGDEYVTIRYKCPRGRYPYKSNGYMSEPEPNYDSDYSTMKYHTLDRRRTPSAGGAYHDDRNYGTMPNPVKPGSGTYKNQPGRIEDYVTGHSSVSDKEKKEWWDEVMEIFNGHLEQQKLSTNYTEGYLSRALKEQGYESDSNLVFRKKEESQFAPLSPVEQKQAYRIVQAGGEPPLQGFRKPAPEKPKDDDDVEYYPITSTLTKIRVPHKNPMPQPQREIICYPITSITRPLDLFAPFPKNVPSFVPFEASPPPPPNRHSSKTSTALKVYSEVKEIKKPGRHQACFQTNYYRRETPSNKIGTITIRKHTKAEPLSRSKSAGPLCSTKFITSSVKEETNGVNGRHISRRQTYRVSSVSPARPSSKITDLRKSSPSPVAFGRSISKERTFAEEKKRLEETLPLSRRSFTASTNILRDPSLKSPDEVKKAVRSYAQPLIRSKSAPKKIVPGSTLRTSSFHQATSAKKTASTAGRKEEKSLKMSVSVTSRDKDLRKKPLIGSTQPPTITQSNIHSSRVVEKKSPKQTTKTSSTLSLARTSSTFSVDSTGSRKVKSPIKKPLTISRSTSRDPSMPLTLHGGHKPKPPKAVFSSKSDSNVLRKVKESMDLIRPQEIATTFEKEIQRDIKDAIMQHQETVRSDNFFQNLFLRDSSPTPSGESNVQPISSVLEKTKYWNTLSAKSEPSLRRTCPYLSQKRPVTDSKFLSMESNHYHQSRSLSPTYRRRKPRGRRVQEQVNKFDSFYQLTDEESEFGDRAEEIIYKYEQRSSSEPRSKTEEVWSTSQTDSQEKVFYEYPRVFTPTREVRSPSRRRIQSFRDSHKSETKKVIRASSLSSADERSRRSLYECSELSHSAGSLNFLERHGPHCRLRNSDRFIDLNKFYSNLERVGQLERATSSTDLRPIRKEGDIIDFDEWKKVRAHERAEKELHYLVGKLKQDQRDKDFLFRPKDVEDVKWRELFDSGLRCKEKSVEDLRESFEKKLHEEGLDDAKKTEIDAEKDTYKPFWRGTSVADSATNMVVKYSSKDTPRLSDKQEKRLCLSNRLISTLSKEQVNKIKNQLSEIYSSPSGQPKDKCEITEDYIITVDDHNKGKINTLKVRCNSSITKEEMLGPLIRRKDSQSGALRSESTGSITSHSLPPRPPQQSKTFERISKQVNRFETELSEVEKRRLSQTLSREIQDKVLERKTRGNSPVLLARETRGAILAEKAKKTLPDVLPLPPPPTEEQFYSIEYCRSEIQANGRDSSRDASLEKISDKKTVRARRISIGETESNSSDISKNTVIYKEKQPTDGIKTKIKYFEEKKEEEPPKTIYHAREYSSPDEEEILKAIEEKMKAKEKEVHEKAIVRHQELSTSVSDFKELFGEKESSRVNFPIPRPPPPPDKPPQEDVKSRIRTSSLTISNGSSLDSLYRSRSASPTTDRIQRIYLNKIQTGDVKKIKDKFESLNTTTKKNFFELGPLRKIRSDPELNKVIKNPHKVTIRDHEVGDVSWITHKFEIKNSAATRGRSRTRRVISPVPRVSLRKEDRLMPHIDIISKTASLKQDITKSPSPTHQQPPLHSGEVERIRCKFESPDRTSLLGQMYTSSPDISELKDISTYLSGSWIAHKYPKRRDNARSPTSPEKGPEGEHVKRREVHHRSCSTSPPRTKTLVTSILKPYYDIFADQKFDPMMHRPKARYVPDKIDELWKKVNNGFKKPPAVKFEEADVVPPLPPTKGVPLIENGLKKESPHRYFETDVNIHYKTPIRYEYKEAIPEEELARRQAEAMKKLYQEERRRKYLQELQDMNSRRHTDNFTPSQKSPIPLNRYDDFNADISPKSPGSQPYPRTVARALYNFQGQTARELTFKKGDVIYIRRQIDKNWYEGEHNAMIGLLPANYVEIITKDGVRQPPKKPSEGQARAKFNFQAQSGIELSLNKGELVTLTRRVDENWFEGKIANRKGIFPVSYVEVLTDIGAEDYSPTQSKPVGAPASHSLITYPTPSLDTLRTNLNNEFNTLTNGHPPNGVLRETKTIQKTEVLHVDTNSEPIAYRALYKYHPQNNDELELQEGDIVYVLEKCDDGWYVGTSQRTGYFGTFPGNYVERV